jgi:cytochrome c556
MIEIALFPDGGLEMRRIATFVVAVAVSLGGVALLADKAKTPDDLDKAMKRVGAAQTALNKAITAKAYADAKKQVKAVDEGLEDAQNFWVLNKKDDAITFGKEARAKVAVLDKALSAPAPDATAVTAAFREVGASCGGCHRTYRVADDNNNFILKPGSIK